MTDPLTLNELQHIEALLNSSVGCDVCASARQKVEQMIAEMPVKPAKVQDTIAGHPVTRERG
jgi:citrate lyase gamma subunit